MKRLFLICAAVLISWSPRLSAQTIMLDELDLAAMEAGWGSPHARQSVEEHPLTVAGKTFARGVGTHAVSTMLLHLDKKAARFTASVGVDDETGNDKASIEFLVLGDKRVLWKSGVMKRGMEAKQVDVDVSGVRRLGLLVTDAGDGIDYDHADWCDAAIAMRDSVAPASLTQIDRPAPYILTPRPPSAPRINGASIFGVRPAHPLLYAIAATGDRPMKFSASTLPPGVVLDAEGRLTGRIDKPGIYEIDITASNAAGSAKRKLVLSCGETIALTPPMGWNSWNCWACAVDDAKVRSSADAMVRSGLAQHGWTYINIDDCWEIKPDATEAILKGTARDSLGMINTNGKFPDMTALADYVHGKGLKIGIYSGPGPTTCAGFTASYGYETQDARRYAGWGIDYLKYDWCSYSEIEKERSVTALQKPYLVMRQALDGVPRDIVYSLCQYGMGNVWEWGSRVGGNCWRTTGDINDTWASMSKIGFGQAGHERFAGPGRWNDPDMLVVGMVGWGPELHATRLTPDEQYTHISLWSLLAAPLLIGCDLDRLDPFTLNLLTNDEVIAVDQDPLGKGASRVVRKNGVELWMKEMQDGSKAVGIFYTGADSMKSPADYFAWEKRSPRKVTVSAKDLGLKGRFTVRDLWRQRTLGKFTGSFTAAVPYHGVGLYRVTLLTR